MGRQGQEMGRQLSGSNNSSRENMMRGQTVDSEAMGEVRRCRERSEGVSFTWH